MTGNCFQLNSPYTFLLISLYVEFQKDCAVPNLGFVHYTSLHEMFNPLEMFNE